jgi:hypothetical protein
MINDNNEPDITVFYYNISEEFRDIVVIEFKGPNAKELQNGVVYMSYQGIFIQLLKQWMMFVCFWICNFEY